MPRRGIRTERLVGTPVPDLMKLPDLENISEFIPVPEEFQSFEKGAPFSTCSMCHGHLLEDGTQYIIEKGYNRGETSFEYALCMECREKLMKGLSVKSLQLIEHYFDERVDLAARRARLIQSDPDDHRPWISQCVLSGTPLRRDSEYQFCGVCDGPHLLFAYLPYAICGEEVHSLCARLSRQTRDRIDQFVEDVLGVPGGSIDIPMVL